MKNGFLNPYFLLTQDLKTDVVILGGGISGALLAHSLSEKGVAVVLLERGHMAMGSTAASTALLQYDIDLALHELIDRMGEKRAVRAYELSLRALNDLIEIAPKVGGDTELTKRPSLRLARTKKDAAFLEKEYEARSRSGFDVELWDATRITKNLPFAWPAVLETTPSATADPYRLTHALLHSAADNGALLFDKAGEARIERRPRSVVVHTKRGPKITARKIVIACGYEAVDHLPIKVVSLSSTYALVTEPLPDENFWYKNSSFWTTGDPYYYGRTTPDNRVIFGGGDEPFYNPSRRDELLRSKTKKLESELKKFFPETPLRTDYSWAGTFIETGDGLPYIGGIKQLPHTLFALGYGGNGITFSQLAADILADLITGRANKDAEIFSFDRTTD